MQDGKRRSALLECIVSSCLFVVFFFKLSNSSYLFHTEIATRDQKRSFISQNEYHSVKKLFLSKQKAENMFGRHVWIPRQSFKDNIADLFLK